MEEGEKIRSRYLMVSSHDVRSMHSFLDKRSPTKLILFLCYNIDRFIEKLSGCSLYICITRSSLQDQAYMAWVSELSAAIRRRQDLQWHIKALVLTSRMGIPPESLKGLLPVYIRNKHTLKMLLSDKLCI